MVNELPSEALVRAAFERHRLLFNARARQEWLDNFVEQPFIEEPAHSPRRIGREHFGAVMDAVVESGSRAMIDKPFAAICNGSELAVHFLVRDTDLQSGPELHIIEVFEIAPCGRVAGVRAFVPDNGLPSNLKSE